MDERRMCLNCTYRLALFDENEPSKISRTEVVCNKDCDKTHKKNDDVCAAHLFAGTAEAREGRR